MTSDGSCMLCVCLVWYKPYILGGSYLIQTLFKEWVLYGTDLFTTSSSHMERAVYSMNGPYLGHDLIFR